VKDLNAALCLVLVVEGLFLFAMPGLWKEMAERLRTLAERDLRLVGAVMIVVGLLALHGVRRFL
jgi:uncharacterized protein